MKTEWSKVKTLVLVYPAGVSYYEHLTFFYHELINKIPEDIHITLLIKPIQLKYNLEFKRGNIQFEEVPELSDIWVRDFAPFQTKNNILIQFKPNPINYHFYSGKLFEKILGMPLIDTCINLDGGNFASNGEIGICTTRILKDNKKNTVLDYVSDLLGLRGIITIPVEPADKLGHIDGTMVFLDENTLMVGGYSDTLPSLSKYSNKIFEIVDNLGFNIIKVPHGYIERIRTYGEIDSAVGIYVNFLRLNNLFLLPDFEEKNILKEYKTKIQIALHQDINFIEIPNIKPLARLGGLIHCLSKVYYE